MSGATPALADRYLAPGSEQATTVAKAPTITGLDDDLDQLLNDPRLNGGHAGVVVRNATTGAIVYSRNGDKRFNPGSNEKLLTSAAAVDVLGLDYRFTTKVAFDGTRNGNTVIGNLYLKGTGDPTMQAAGYDELAAKVAEAGITVVKGSVIADDTWFDNVRLGTEWAWDDQPFAYAAQISALTVAANDVFDTGAIRVDSGPGAAVGDPAAVTLVPATNYVKIENRAVTGPAGSARTIAVDRPNGTNTLVVTGSAPLGGAVGSNLRTVSGPASYAAALFRAALVSHGVKVKKLRTSVGETPGSATQVAVKESMPLSQLLPKFLKLSNNGHAEILTKAMGRKVKNQGTWSAGLQVSSSFLSSVGVDAPNLRMVDGAGLSRQDLVTPEQITALLRAVQSKPWFSTWYDALPIAGNPDPLIGGTLRSRMVNTAAAGNVHAKTGSLTSVSALSGYVTNADGQKLTFSILTKDFLGASPKSLEDAIAVTLANSGASHAVTKRDLAKLRKPRQLRNDPTTRVDESSLECSWIKESSVKQPC
ncbi:MAG TPA: D-alanyl-D-alanine carboxypeptidase/D-alanyl-D-alanine-endopeptidase [Nocardioides sp.]